MELELSLAYLVFAPEALSTQPPEGSIQGYFDASCVWTDEAPSYILDVYYGDISSWTEEIPRTAGSGEAFRFMTDLSFKINTDPVPAGYSYTLKLIAENSTTSVNSSIENLIISYPSLTIPPSSPALVSKSWTYTKAFTATLSLTIDLPEAPWPYVCGCYYTISTSSVPPFDLALYTYTETTKLTFQNLACNTTYRVRMYSGIIMGDTILISTPLDVTTSCPAPTEFVYSLEEAAKNAKPLKNSGHVTRARLYAATKNAGWIELFYYKTRLNAKTQVTTKAVLTLLDGSTVSARFSYALASAVKRNHRVIELGPTPAPTTLLTSPAVSHSGVSASKVRLKPVRSTYVGVGVTTTPTVVLDPTYPFAYNAAAQTVTLNVTYTGTCTNYFVTTYGTGAPAQFAQANMAEPGAMVLVQVSGLLPATDYRVTVAPDNDDAGGVDFVTNPAPVPPAAPLLVGTPVCTKKNNTWVVTFWVQETWTALSAAPTNFYYNAFTTAPPDYGSSTWYNHGVNATWATAAGSKTAPLSLTLPAATYTVRVYAANTGTEMMSIPLDFTLAI